ncbi:type III-B CRISPR-associated protein Cas10/Cmr2 [Sulfobacillus thermotolerans]|uniref:Type III-B CRISPR-associated protein Cas10/Cmr2 n=1 Tax=Sulfobacillus thermotolerans TaxID=338644 RepID=A0ABM6RSR2_9FIRM|nr:type III-B CRISPR-associated protein Cas10/Cmr2 [Sulfobacillus thermotolerans]
MALRKFHFALGPVQSFVSQSRRTRDLWAGSFIISHLTAQAMANVIQQGGRIEFPAISNQSGRVTDVLVAAAINGTPPAHFLGTIPNRFVAEVPEAFDPAQPVQAVSREWQNIARHVWDASIAPYAHYGNQTQQIWARQVDTFWEMTWALGDDMDLLDRRKNWRTHTWLPEEGVKCVMMPQFQEISGQWASQKRQAFWHAVKAGLASDLDLKDDEHLCAIALIKRLYPVVAEKYGWTGVPATYPSTIELAVSSWRERQRRENPKWYQAYIHLARHAKFKDMSEGRHDVDPALFYKGTLTNRELWAPEMEELRRQMQQALDAMPSRPTPYYAVLLMDGDHLGSLLQSQGGARVSEALAQFTHEVPPIIKAASGTLVYAGGDDVLALLPRENVLQAAFSLRQSYQKAMHQLGGTISGTALFAHMHAPLTTLIPTAHKILDQTAKDGNGRDSLALAIWNSGGLDVSWVSKWDPLIADMPLQRLSQYLGDTVSSQFLFKVQELERRLGNALPLEDWVPLLMSELRKSFDDEGVPSLAALQDIIHALITLSQGRNEITQNLGLSSALKVLRFIAKDQEVIV